MAESEEELKSLLIKVKEENEKASLRLNICIPWLIHVDVWQKPTKFCKAIILQSFTGHLHEGQALKFSFDPF